MKTIKEIKFSPDNFFTKSDKIAIVEFINSNNRLFVGNHNVGQKKSIFHHRTNLQIHVIGAGMLSVKKYVDKGISYQYSCYANFLIN